jgi:hypothetical protein
MRIIERLALGPHDSRALLCLLFISLLAAPLLQGCSPQSMAQAATSTVKLNSQREEAASPAAPTPTTSAPASTSTSEVATLGSPTPAGTPTVRPTPTGAAPANPVDLLGIFGFFTGDNALVKRDVIQLDGAGTTQVLFTDTGPTNAITTEQTSEIGVGTYDPVFREWNVTWRSERVPGMGSPLPAATSGQVDGFNGGNLLGTGVPVLVVRSTTRDGKAHLFLWQWNRQKHEGELLRMAPANGGAEQNAAFDADLDLNVADLDGDGKYEVAADNVGGVQIWKWDGSKYVVEAGR